MSLPYLSIIIPVHNEEKNIGFLYSEVLEVMKNDFSWYSYEIIIINDGSTDKTWEEMKNLRKLSKDNLVLIDTQRNYGQSIALDIGFRYARWDTVFTLDWDGQNDPSDMKKLFDVVYNGLSDNGLFIINFQNADVHPEAETLPNGTKYNYKILKDKQTKEKRFFAYYSKDDIDNLRRNLFEVQEYHTEGGKEQKNWHVYTLKKIGKGRRLNETRIS